MPHPWLSTAGRVRGSSGRSPRRRSTVTACATGVFLFGGVRDGRCRGRFCQLRPIDATTPRPCGTPPSESSTPGSSAISSASTAFWLTEHHFQYEGYEIVPNGLMTGAILAERTEQIPDRHHVQHRGAVASPSPRRRLRNPPQHLEGSRDSRDRSRHCASRGRSARHEDRQLRQSGSSGSRRTQPQAVRRSGRGDAPCPRPRQLLVPW